MKKTLLTPAKKVSRTQHGASLIMVMVILTIVSLVGVAGIQISTLSERSARNDRDQQIAWQSAEAGLVDAEFDLFGPGASTRRATFTSGDDAAFIADCGDSGASLGLCALVTSGKPAWLTVDFEATGNAAKTAAYGAFTGRNFAAGDVGVQPAKAPRYVIEPIQDRNSGGVGRDLSTIGGVAYRVTSMGFGPREDIQAVVQMLYRN